jgi:hypothetical protein
MEPSYNTSCRNRSIYFARWYIPSIQDSFVTPAMVLKLQHSEFVLDQTGLTLLSPSHGSAWQSFTLPCLYFTLAQAKPCLRLLPASPSPPRPQFNPSSDHVPSVHTAAVPTFSHVRIIPTTLRTHSLVTCTTYIISETAKTVKTHISSTLVPCNLIACMANCCSFSLYSWAAREVYFCCASVVVQLCCRKNVNYNKRYVT